MTGCSSRLASWLTRTMRGRKLVLRRGIGASVTGPMRIARPTRHQRCACEAVAIVRAQPIPWDRYRQIKRKFCTIVGGVASPLLANIYMNRFLKHWRRSGCGEAFRAHIVNYADDFVILSQRWAAEALTWTKVVMTKLGLTLNEVKTSVRDARTERFDFLGYTFGPYCYQRNGKRYLGASPSEKSVKRVKTKVSDVLVPGNMQPWTEVCSQLNSLLRGWSAYFCYGTRGRAYKAVDHHVCERVRHFLSRRHKVSSRGTKRFPSDMIFGKLGVQPLDYRRGPYNETSRKAGCGKSACPV